MTSPDDHPENTEHVADRPFAAQWLWIMLVVAVTAFGIALWAERQQEHSHLWAIDGDRFQLTSFLAPAHHHSREIPFTGIDRITSEPDPDREEISILVLHYGPVAFRMPSQGEDVIGGFDGYVERLQNLLDAAHSGEQSARVLHLDPYLIATVAAAATSLIAWVLLFVLILRSPPRVSEG